MMDLSIPLYGFPRVLCKAVRLTCKGLSIPLYGFIMSIKIQELLNGYFQFHCMDSPLQVLKLSSNFVYVFQFHCMDSYHHDVLSNCSYWNPGLSIPLYGFPWFDRLFLPYDIRTAFQFHCMDSAPLLKQPPRRLHQGLSIPLYGFALQLHDALMSLNAFQFHCMDSAPSCSMFTVEISLISIAWILFH